MTRYGLRGWYGNSHGHALAAKGIRLYSKKPVNEAFFYAQKTETILPFAIILDAVRRGKNYQQIKSEYPSADSEDTRSRGIKAVETMSGSNTLSQIDRNGVDQTIEKAKNNPNFKESVQNVISDPQKSSFIHPIKLKLLQDGMRGVE